MAGTLICTGCGELTQYNNTFWKYRSVVPDDTLPAGMKQLPPSGGKKGVFGKQYLGEQFCDQCSMRITGYIQSIRDKMEPTTGL